MLANIWRSFGIFVSDTYGATAVEYGLLIGLAALGLAAGHGAIADLVIQIFEMLGEQVDTATPTP